MQNGIVRVRSVHRGCLLATVPGDGPGMEAVIWIGTSGWMYRDWNGRFYPADLPARDQLAFYTRRFPTVEINRSFYRWPTRDNFAA